MRRGRQGLWRSRKRPELFDTAEAYPVGFAESSIDGSCFGDAHLGTANQRGNVRRIGVAVAYKTPRGARFVDCSPKNPSISGRIRLSLLQSGTDSQTALTQSYAKEARMGNVPIAVNE